MRSSSIAVLDAPSNLGLRPPLPGVVPGVYKLGWALREQGIIARLAARDAGVVIPPRYLPDWNEKTVRNEAALAAYSRQLADRIQRIFAAGDFAFILGGDCSILLGGMLALRRAGRYGLIFIDGHLDFRHPGNAPAVGSAAGEDLALVTGRGGEMLTNLENLAPLVRAADVVALGFRPADEYAAEVRAAGIAAFDVPAIMRAGPGAAGQAAVAALERQGVAGYWIHVDADVLDAAIMPAVDSPDPGGLTYTALARLLRPLLASPLAVGLEITVFDPDLDPDQTLSRKLTQTLVAAFGKG